MSNERILKVEDIAGTVGNDVESRKRKSPNTPTAKRDAVEQRAKASGDVAPVTNPETPGVLSTGISSVDRKDVSSGIPKGGGAILSMSITAFEDDLKKGDESMVKDSLFLQGIYAGLKLYEGIFSFAFTAGDYMSSIDSLYPTEQFNDNEMKTLWEKRFHTRYVELAKKIKGKEYKTKKEQNKAMEELKRIEQRLLKAKGFDPKSEEGKAYSKKLLDEAEKYYKMYADKDVKLVLTDEELSKFSEIEDADSYISTAYVCSHLGINPSLPNENGDSVTREALKSAYDPKTLMAKLLHADYIDGKNDGTKQNLFTRVDRSEKFNEMKKSGNLPAGTVVFFERALDNEKKILMCGIVGMDGKIRYQNSKGLETLTDFDDGPNFTETLSVLTKNLTEGKMPNKTAANEVRKDVIGAVSSAVDSGSNGFVFKGAFMPTTTLGEKETDEEKAEREKEEEEKAKKKKEEEDDNLPSTEIEDLSQALDALDASSTAKEPTDGPVPEQASSKTATDSEAPVEVEEQSEKKPENETKEEPTET